jgi:hypothetical protein
VLFSHRGNFLALFHTNCLFFYCSVLPVVQSICNKALTHLDVLVQVSAVLQPKVAYLVVFQVRSLKIRLIHMICFVPITHWPILGWNVHNSLEPFFTRLHFLQFQLQLFLLNQNLTWAPLLISVFLPEFDWIWLNLPDLNLKLFCFDVQNNFRFRSGKFSQI